MRGDLGLLRRPPGGWLESRAVPLRHRTSSGRTSESDADQVDTSLLLEVQWEVRVPGRAPYVVAEERKAPVWVSETHTVGSGRRWWTTTLRKTWGLTDGVEIPVWVDPADGTRLWVDWDAAYDAHEPVWRTRSAVEREVAGRRGWYDGVAQRIADPFAGRVVPEDRHLVEEQVAREEAELARQTEAALAAAPTRFEPDEEEAWRAMGAEMARLDAVGRPASATVVGLVDTGRTLVGTPVWRIDLEVDDGAAPRRVALEVPLRKRRTKAYRVGTEVRVKIDPDDAERLTLVAD